MSLGDFYEDKSAIPLANDQSSWPRARSVRNFEKIIEKVYLSGGHDRVRSQADPTTPADIADVDADTVKHYVRQWMSLPPNLPEFKPYFLADAQEILSHCRRSLPTNVKLLWLPKLCGFAQPLLRCVLLAAH